jgi:ATP-dependent DNA ligase
VSASGVALFDQVCEMDLKGIVAKHAAAPYLSYHAISTWYKIKNLRYSQMAGRHESSSANGTASQYRGGILAI